MQENTKSLAHVEEVGLTTSSELHTVYHTEAEQKMNISIKSTYQLMKYADSGLQTNLKVSRLSFITG